METYKKVIWQSVNGKPISCLEKLKVLNQNLEEILSIYREAKEDAILLGVAPESFDKTLALEISKID